MLDARRAAPWAGLPALEAGLGALAAFALADIAHRVFRPLGPTDPGLALVHFADLPPLAEFERKARRRLAGHARVCQVAVEGWYGFGWPPAVG